MNTHSYRKVETALEELDERGFVLYLFPFILFIIMLTLAMAMDFANTYASKVRAGGAAEQAVLAAAAARLTETNSNIRLGFDNGSAEQAYLTQRYNASVVTNLFAYGIDTVTGPIMPNSNKVRYLANESTLTFIPSALGNEITLQGRVSLEVPKLMGGVYKMLGMDYTPIIVTGTATTVLRAGNYVFLFDLSLSASCPAEPSVPCDCNFGRDAQGRNCREVANSLPSGSSNRLKYEFIREVILDVVDRLDEDRDRVALIGFNNTSFSMLDFRPAVSGQAQEGFSKTDLENALTRIVPEFERTEISVDPSAIDQIIPRGSTNISDAFLSATDAIIAAGLHTGSGGPVNVILISDGVPTSMRFFPAAGSNLPNVGGANIYATPGLSFPENDYLMFNLADDIQPGVAQEFYPGYIVPTLSYRQWDRFTYTAGTVPASIAGPANGFPDSILPPCHLDNLGPGIDVADDRVVEVGDVATREAGMRSCLNSWTSLDPVSGATAFGANFPFSNSLQVGDRYDFRQLPFIAAVEAATRLLVDTESKIYAIAYGPNQPPGSRLYNIDDTASVNFRMLSNFANDPYFINEDAFKDHPDVQLGFSDDEYSFAKRKEMGIPNGGVYYGTSVAKFKEAFDALIKDSKLRLTGIG